VPLEVHSKNEIEQSSGKDIDVPGTVHEACAIAHRGHGRRMMAHELSGDQERDHRAYADYQVKPAHGMSQFRGDDAVSLGLRQGIFQRLLYLGIAGFPP
jgi:hypothetical protein